jgi:hypothetical protein
MTQPTASWPATQTQTCHELRGCARAPGFAEMSVLDTLDTRVLMR